MSLENFEKSPKTTGYNPKVYKEWVTYAKSINEPPYFYDERFESYEFQCWLFDNCFSDVIK